MIVRKLIKPDGTEVEYDGPLSMAQIHTILDAAALDVVALRHMGDPLHVMLVDDIGAPRLAGSVNGEPFDNGPGKGLPMNPSATELYHANCVAGAPPIYGPVMIVPDNDFAEDL